jgi:hypothetical protein
MKISSNIVIEAPSLKYMERSAICVLISTLSRSKMTNREAQSETWYNRQSRTFSTIRTCPSPIVIFQLQKTVNTSMLYYATHFSLPETTNFSLPETTNISGFRQIKICPLVVSGKLKFTIFMGLVSWFVTPNVTC